MSTQEAPIKPWYKSKIFWVNLAALLLMFTETLPSQVTNEAALAILAIVNIILRFITKKPIHA